MFVKWCLGKDNHIVCCRRVPIFHLPFSTRTVDYSITFAPVLMTSFEKMCWKWEVASFLVYKNRQDLKERFANWSFPEQTFSPSYACLSADMILIVKSKVKTTIWLNIINSRNWIEQLAAWITIMTTPTWQRGATIRRGDRRELRMRSPFLRSNDTITTDYYEPSQLIVSCRRHFLYNCSNSRGVL